MNNCTGTGNGIGREGSEEAVNSPFLGVVVLRGGEQGQKRELLSESGGRGPEEC